MKTDKTINGKYYPLWQQFIDKKKEWIGGILRDGGDNIDKQLGAKTMETEIIDIILEKNGKDSAFFSIVGKDFDAGFDVGHGGIGGNNQSDEWLSFSGYMGYEFMIKKPTKE